MSDPAQPMGVSVQQDTDDGAQPGRDVQAPDIIPASGQTPTEPREADTTTIVPIDAQVRASRWRRLFTVIMSRPLSVGGIVLGLIMVVRLAMFETTIDVAVESNYVSLQGPGIVDLHRKGPSCDDFVTRVEQSTTARLSLGAGDSLRVFEAESARPAPKGNWKLEYLPANGTGHEGFSLCLSQDTHFSPSVIAFHSNVTAGQAPLPYQRQLLRSGEVRLHEAPPWGFSDYQIETASLKLELGDMVQTHHGKAGSFNAEQGFAPQGVIIVGGGAGTKPSLAVRFAAASGDVKISRVGGRPPFMIQGELFQRISKDPVTAALIAVTSAILALGPFLNAVIDACK